MSAISDSNQQVILASQIDEAKFSFTQPGEYLVVLDKPGQEIELAATFDVTGDSKIDLTVIVHHQAPHTRAQTTLKGVARDRASIRFVGRIIIDENCGDTQSFLTEKILLLSDQARAEAVPDLEISSDDVKCSHAATISNIPQDQLFYLQSRGIPQPEAENLIVAGFLAD